MSRQQSLQTAVVAKHTRCEATDVEAEGTTAIAYEKAKHTTIEATGGKRDRSGG